MWAALRSDLKEFVSGVADETSNVVGTVGGETPGTEPTVGEDGQMLDTGFENTGVVEEAADEVARLRNHEETYTTPLDTDDEEVKEFLSTIDIESKTEEIAKLLEEYPESVKVYFESLVPTTITYKEFWERYFFRCDENRIVEQWERETEERRQARAEAINASISKVTNLFGGAINAVSQTLSNVDARADQPVPTSPFNFQGLTTPNATQTAEGLNLFGTSGRPPFVMNTVVDDDDEEEDIEEEEEEELGWDDDDDDEDEDDVIETKESGEEITFSGGTAEAMDSLQEKLANVLTERDLLKDTVETQGKEIAALRKGEVPESLTSELEQLKMSLFEKNTEIAALKESLKDTHEDEQGEKSKKESARLASLERDVESLSSDINVKDEELKKATRELESSKQEAEKLRTELEAQKAKVAEIKAASEKDLDAMRNSMAITKAEVESLRSSLESSGDSASELQAALNTASQAKSKAQSLALELDEAHKLLEESTEKATMLEEELAKTKALLTEREAEFASKLQQMDLDTRLDADESKLPDGDSKAKSSLTSSPELRPEIPRGPPSPSSMSTGVKIDAALAEPSTAADDDDGWGDDW